ncbi:hypothetical protein ABK040_003642 [Willaertia magna]
MSETEDIEVSQLQKEEIKDNNSSDCSTLVTAFKVEDESNESIDHEEEDKEPLLKQSSSFIFNNQPKPKVQSSPTSASMKDSISTTSSQNQFEKAMQNKVLSSSSTKSTIYSVNSTSLIPHKFYNFVKTNFGDGKSKEITLAIYQFSGISNINSNEENVFINNCLNLINPIIQKHHGIYYKYMDDHFIVVFDVKYTANAIECAFESIDLIRKNALESSRASNLISSSNERSYLLLENIGIAVHTCSSKAGPIHFEDHHSDLVFMHPAREVIRRMASFGRLYDVPILITSQTLQKYDFNNPPSLGRPVNVSPVGKFYITNSVFDLHQVYDTNWDVFLYSADRKREFKNALDMFQQRKFVVSTNTFSKLHRLNDNDKVALFYIKVCRMYQQSELPSHWDGVIMIDKDCEPFPLGKKQKSYYIQTGISAAFHLGDEQFMSHGKDKEEEVKLLQESLNQKQLMIKDMKEILGAKESELAKLHEITELLMKEKKQLTQQLKNQSERKPLERKSLSKRHSTTENVREEKDGCFSFLLCFRDDSYETKDPKKKYNKVQPTNSNVNML